MVAYDDTQLALAGYNEAQAANVYWQSVTQVGKPVAVVLDTFNKVNLTPIPKPLVDGKPVVGATPTDKDTTFPWPPENWCLVCTTSDLSFSALTYQDLGLAVAFEVIAKELQRDSDHQDIEGSQIAKQMSDTFWALSFPEMLESEIEWRG